MMSCSKRGLRLLAGLSLGAVIPLWGQSSIDINCSAQVSAGSSASCAVTLSLTGGATANNLTFGALVSPAGSAPALTSGLVSFSDSIGGGFASETANSVAVLWASISPALSGARTLGSISFVVPPGANAGQTYSVAITGASASISPGGSLSIGPASSVTVPALAPVSIDSPSSLPNGAVGSPYATTWFAASGGTGSYTWSASGLPAGLSVSPGGQLSGTPTQSGSFAPRFTVTDSNSNSASASLTLLIGAPSSSCNYTLTGNGGFSQTGGRGSITVTTGSACLWTATVPSGVTWVALSGNASGMGNETVPYQVLADSSGARTGSVTIGGVSFAVVQTGVTTAQAGSLPHFAAGEGWDTTITVVNLWSVAEEVRLNLIGDNGNPVALPLVFPQTSSTATQTVSTIDRTLNPGAELIVQTSNASAPTAVTGWVQVITNGRADGSCIFRWSTAQGEQEAVVLNEDRSTSAFLLSFDNTGGRRTGVAVTNVSDRSVAIPVILRDSTGVQLGTATISMPAFGHSSFMLDDTYPVTKLQYGTAEFDVQPGSQIGVVGIRASPSGAITSVPVLAR